MTAACSDYCDEQCRRPAGHEGMHWGQYDTVWRAATQAEIDAFTGEMEITR